LPDFETHSVDSAPEGSQNLLRGLKDQVGFVPNLAATMAESPALLESFLALRALAHGSSLDPIAREVIAIAVSFETGCTYCVAAHTTLALKNGARPEVVDAVRAGTTLGDSRLQALVRFARAIVRRQGDVKQRTQDLLTTGMSREQVLEALVAIAVPMLAGSVLQLAAVELDDAFAPQAWKRPA
jgi:uncharacterized peroxidase-related enzyme